MDEKINLSDWGESSSLEEICYESDSSDFILIDNSKINENYSSDENEKSFTFISNGIERENAKSKLNEPLNCNVINAQNQISNKRLKKSFADIVSTLPCNILRYEKETPIADKPFPLGKLVAPKLITSHDLYNYQNNESNYDSEEENQDNGDYTNDILESSICSAQLQNLENEDCLIFENNESGIPDKKNVCCDAMVSMSSSQNSQYSIFQASPFEDDHYIENSEKTIHKEATEVSPALNDNIATDSNCCNDIGSVEEIPQGNIKNDDIHNFKSIKSLSSIISPKYLLDFICLQSKESYTIEPDMERHLVSAVILFVFMGISLITSSYFIFEDKLYQVKMGHSYFKASPYYSSSFNDPQQTWLINHQGFYVRRSNKTFENVSRIQYWNKMKEILNSMLLLDGSSRHKGSFGDNLSHINYATLYRMMRRRRRVTLAPPLPPKPPGTAYPDDRDCIRGRPKWLSDRSSNADYTGWPAPHDTRRAHGLLRYEPSAWGKERLGPVTQRQHCSHVNHSPPTTDRLRNHVTTSLSTGKLARNLLEVFKTKYDSAPGIHNKYLGQQHHTSDIIRSSLYDPLILSAISFAYSDQMPGAGPNDSSSSIGVGPNSSMLLSLNRTLDGTATTTHPKVGKESSSGSWLINASLKSDHMIITLDFPVDFQFIRLNSSQVDLIGASHDSQLRVGSGPAKGPGPILPVVRPTGLYSCTTGATRVGSAVAVIPGSGISDLTTHTELRAKEEVVGLFSHPRGDRTTGPKADDRPRAHTTALAIFGALERTGSPEVSRCRCLSNRRNPIGLRARPFKSLDRPCPSYQDDTLQALITFATPMRFNTSKACLNRTEFRTLVAKGIHLGHFETRRPSTKDINITRTPKGFCSYKNLSLARSSKFNHCFPHKIPLICTGWNESSFLNLVLTRYHGNGSKSRRLSWKRCKTFVRRAPSNPSSKPFEPFDIEPLLNNSKPEKSKISKVVAKMSSITAHKYGKNLGKWRRSRQRKDSKGMILKTIRFNVSRYNKSNPWNELLYRKSGSNSSRGKRCPTEWMILTESNLSTDALINPYPTTDTAIVQKNWSMKRAWGRRIDRKSRNVDYRLTNSRKEAIYNGPRGPLLFRTDGRLPAEKASSVGKGALPGSGSASPSTVKDSFASGDPCKMAGDRIRAKKEARCVEREERKDMAANREKDLNRHYSYLKDEVRSRARSLKRRCGA